MSSSHTASFLRLKISSKCRRTSSLSASDMSPPVGPTVCCLLGRSWYREPRYPHEPAAGSAGRDRREQGGPGRERQVLFDGVGGPEDRGLVHQLPHDLEADGQAV